jgi:hypothetical protein
MDVIRAGDSLRMGNVRVRLVRKLAERIDGCGPLAPVRRAGDSAACQSSSAVDCRTMGRASELHSFATAHESHGPYRTVSSVGSELHSGSAARRVSHGELRRDRASIQPDH